MKKGALALLIIILLVSTGWAVAARNHNKNEDNNSATTSQPDTKPSETTQYLVIKEWDVRFPLPNGLENDLYYQKLANNDEETYEILSHSVDLDNCAPISVFRTQKSGFGNITIDNYHYGQRKGAQACDTTDSTRQQQAANVQERVSQALEKLESNP